MNSYKLSNFVGKKINIAYTEKHGDGDRMLWQVDGEWFILFAEGDCCSRSIFYHCDNADALQDATLLEFEDAEGYTEDADDEYMQANFLKFKTNKGHCTIEFRNYSNGYYSGWCEVNKTEQMDINTIRRSYEILRDF